MGEERETEGEMALFSLVGRPQSFHLQQDTDLPVNTEETDRLLSLLWDKRSAPFFLSVRNKRLAAYKNSNNDKRGQCLDR